MENDYMAIRVARDGRAHAGVAAVEERAGGLHTTLTTLCGAIAAYRLPEHEAGWRMRCTDCERESPGFRFWRDG